MVQYKLRINFLLFEFWRAENIFQYLLSVLIVWNLEKVLKNMRYEKNLTACPKHPECMINALEAF